MNIKERIEKHEAEHEAIEDILDPVLNKLTETLFPNYVGYHIEDFGTTTNAAGNFVEIYLKDSRDGDTGCVNLPAEVIDNDTVEEWIAVKVADEKRKMSLYNADRRETQIRQLEARLAELKKERDND